MKRPIQSVVRHLRWSFLHVLIKAWARGLFVWEAAPRMFEWVVNASLILLELYSLSTTYEEAYSEPSQEFVMDVCLKLVDLLWQKVPSKMFEWVLDVNIFINCNSHDFFNGLIYTSTDILFLLVGVN